MPADVIFFTVLHLIVFAYWLGGDLGVFYSSTILTDESQQTPARLAAAKVLLNVDLAPRMALLATLPTGLALAASKGWLTLPVWAVPAAFLAAVLWIGLVLRLHVAHGAKGLQALDTWLRYAFILGLAATAGAGLAGVWAVPTFLSLKLLILAFAVTMGLAIRRALVPFGPAFGALAGGDASPETNAVIKKSIGSSRPFVIAIWIALIAAATLGVATPA
ncbi:MAG: hypothetical protein AAGL49_04455 [Pseudomonadota bacterium]